MGVPSHLGPRDPLLPRHAPKPVPPTWTPLARGQRGRPGPPQPRAGGLRTHSPARTRMMLSLPLDLLLPDRAQTFPGKKRDHPQEEARPPPGLGTNLSQEGPQVPTFPPATFTWGVNIAGPLTPQPAPARGRPTRHKPSLSHTQGGDTGLPRGIPEAAGLGLGCPGPPCVTFGSSGQMTRQCLWLRPWDLRTHRRTRCSSRAPARPAGRGLL